MNIVKILKHVEIDTSSNFKVVRSKSRVMFHEQLLTTECLKYKEQLISMLILNMTLTKRNQVKELYAELALERKRVTDLIISYRKGIPIIIKT